MKNILKLGQKIEECQRHLFNQGYSYEDARNYVKMMFEETGLRLNMFDNIDKKEIENAIEYLHNNILK